MSNPEPPNPNKIAGYQSLVNNFDGDVFSNISYFFTNLEEVGKIAQWNNSELIAVLKSKLKGPALEYFINDPELTSEKSFATIKTKLNTYFDKITTLSHRQQQFSNCKQIPGETIRSYSSRVSNLTINYFGLDNATKNDAKQIVDQTKLAKFLEGLLPQFKELALSKNPTTFSAAVENALLHESNIQLISSEGGNQGSVNNIDRDDKIMDFLQKQAENSNYLISTLSEKLNNISIKNSTPQRSRENSFQRRHCTNCGRNNHVIENCWFIRNQNSRTSSNHNSRFFRPQAVDSRSDYRYRGNLRQIPPVRQPYRETFEPFPPKNNSNTIPKQRVDLNYRRNR